MTAKELVAQSRENSIPGSKPAPLNAESLLFVLVFVLNQVLNDNGQCEREPSSDRAVVARVIASLICLVEDSGYEPDYEHDYTIEDEDEPGEEWKK